jgi:hypothetical protein
MHWRVEPEADGAVVTCEASFEVPGGPLAALFGPLIRAYNQRELDATLANLRTALDAPES